jgi:hemerythrin superfamily protein
VIRKSIPEDIMFLKDPKAISLLKKDHRAVDKLFLQYEVTENPQEKVDLVQEICQALMVHAHLEEKLFYPALRGKVKSKLLDEAFVEHDTLKDLISKIDGCGPDDAFFDAHVTVLREYVHHHVREEEKDIMPEAEGSNVDLDDLGDRIEALKLRLESKIEELGPETGDHNRVEVLQMDGRGIRHH